MNVKGTMIVDYVKMIRANRDKNWDPYLEPEDWDIINGYVFTTNKYSYESFRRLGFACFKVIGGGKLEIARSFGRFTMGNMLQIYKNSILVSGDPGASIKKLGQLKKTFMEGDSETKVVEQGGNWLRYQIVTPSQEQDEERLAAYCHQITGHLEEIADKAGAKNIRAAEIKRVDKGYEIRLEWE